MNAAPPTLQATAPVEISLDYSAIFNATHNAMAFTEAETGRILDVNAAWVRTTGIKREQAVGFAAVELGLWANLKDRDACIGEFRASGRLTNYEARLIFNSLERPYSISGNFVDIAGKRHMLWEFEDISTRKAAEQALRLAANVFNHAHDGIMICDVNQTVLDVNHTFEEITGYSREEIIGKTPRLLKSGRQTPEFYEHMWNKILSDGYCHGEIWNRRKDGEIYVQMMTISSIKDEAGQISHYVGVFSDISQLKNHQERLELLAHYDALTRLPNRVLLADRLDQALAQSRRGNSLLAICYLDLDGFKPVNDQHGHDAGDALLVEIARRLKDGLRGGDTVARLGGDEFVILLCEIQDQPDCERTLNRLLRIIAAPVTVKGVEVGVTASMGVTLFPNDTADADTLMRHADQSMYRAKDAGRNQFHIYEPALDGQMKQRRESLARLAQALENREFQLYYQPKVDMRRGQVLGMEALIRWQHPERGLLLPAEFLPLVEEEATLSLELDRWVLCTALHQLADWQNLGLRLEMNINIFGAYLLSHDFLTELEELLAHHPEIDPKNIELEILETTALEDMDRAGEVFRGCHKLGVSIALDDFGTGYSSLTYFRRLPANTMKIDQSFVRHMLDNTDDLAIVESVISLTHAFNRKLVAEGVETNSHGMVLVQMGCNVAQGYGIAHPMPAEAIPAWLAAFRPQPEWGQALSWTWSKENLPLLIAQSDHNTWVKQIDAALRREVLSDVPELASSHCRFGRWYKGTGRARYGDAPSFIAIEPVHEAIHELGRTLLTLHANGDQEGARARLGELHANRDRIIELLNILMMGLDDLER